MRRLGSHLVLAALLGLLGALAVPGPASAHAYLARSAPADGAILDRAPDVLVLGFTEHVELSATHIDIVDGDGRHWAATSIAVRPHDPSAATDADTEEPADIVAGLPALPANTYHIAWQTLSSDDLHVTSGTLVLGVQRAVSAAGPPPRPGGPGIREAVLRGASLIGLSLLLGGAALALMLAASRPGGRAGPAGLRRRLLGAAGAGGVLAVAASPLQLLVQTSSGSGTFVVQQATSGRWLMRELGLVALLAAVLWARRGLSHRFTPAAIGLGAVGAVLAATGTALLGHPAGGPLATALVGTVHILAAGGWAGSLIAGVAALVPVLRTDPEQVRPLLRAFAVLAAGCLALLTVTGLLMVGVQVSTVDAALTSPYGLLLLAKVSAVLVAGLLGLRTYRRLRRAAPVPRRGLVAEATVLVLVLALAGAMAAAGPAKGPRFPVTTRVATEPQVSGQAADLVDTVQIRPNRPGRNVVTITIADTRRPAPAPVSGVSVQLVGPDGTRKVHAVTRTVDGWTVAIDDIRTPGNWRVSVTVMRQGLPPVTDGHAWSVAEPTRNAASVVFSAAPLQPVIGWLAVLVAGGSLALAGFFWFRRRRAAVRPPAALDLAPPQDVAPEEAPEVGPGEAPEVGPGEASEVGPEEAPDAGSVPRHPVSVTPVNRARGSRAAPGAGRTGR